MILFCSLISVVSGAALSLQGPTNSALARQTDQYIAAFISSLVGLLLSLVWMLFAGKGDMSRLSEVRLWMYMGGMYGVYGLFVTMLGIKYLGLALTVTLTMLGQMAISFLTDVFGWFGVISVESDSLRLLGILSVVLGIALIYIGSQSDNSRKNKLNLWILFPVFLVGVGSGLRASSSAAMSALIGSHEATFVSFVIGTVLTLLVVIAFDHGRLKVRPEAEFKMWHFCGGFYGVAAQFFNIIAVPVLGVTLQSAAGMFGRLLCGVVTDRFGLLQTQKVKATPLRISGIGVIAVGVCMVTAARLMR